MFKKILILILILIAGICLNALREPDTYHIGRSVEINAPAEKIFPYINDFKLWGEWFYARNFNLSGVEKKYYGNTSGQGSVYEWSGNINIGAGRLEIVKSQFPVKIVVAGNFFRPFKNHHQFVFLLEKTEVTGGREKKVVTKVTWQFNHNNTFVAKLIHSIFKIDPMFGPNLQQSLDNLKTLAEEKNRK